jgi:Spy/CpxP family protein refolding chaperone
MRNTTFAPAFAVAMLVLPLAAQAQQQPPGQRAQAEAARGMRGGAMMLERHAAALNLTAQQQAQLQAIRERYQERNAPLMAQLRAAGVDGRGAKADGERAQRPPEQGQRMRERAAGMTPEQREQMRQEMRQRMESMAPEQRAQMRAGHGAAGARAHGQLPESVRPVMQQLRENSRAAAQEARAVLTPEQQARLRQLVQEHRREGGPAWRGQRRAR